MRLKNYGRNQKKRKEYSARLAFTLKNYCEPIIQWTSPMCLLVKNARASGVWYTVYLIVSFWASLYQELTL